ncbi:hypothetical protein ACFQT0_28005 [Hymenobacter humi]|uniref:Uncharacterized protein n=1 Tax=Hymenobacter humi TaxID=1411620 RepID=A0ABW2UEN9_9BACT
MGPPRGLAPAGGVAGAARPRRLRQYPARPHPPRQAAGTALPVAARRGHGPLACRPGAGAAQPFALAHPPVQVLSWAAPHLRLAWLVLLLASVLEPDHDDWPAARAALLLLPLPGLVL